MMSAVQAQFSQHRLLRVAQFAELRCGRGPAAEETYRNPNRTGSFLAASHHQG
jgi:hypothetical protein